MSGPHIGHTARVDFMDGPLKLVHIPLHHYSRYVQPLLQILFPLEEPSSQHNGSQPMGWQSPSGVDEHFGLAAEQGWVDIAKDEFVAMSMEGDGLNAGQRVLELTAPLAMAGISIFFFTTYFSDYVLVPTVARDSVIEALERRGFKSEQPSAGDVRAGSSSSNPGSVHHHHQRMTNSEGSLPDEYLPPTIHELQSRNVALLKRYQIKPTVQRGLRLIHCAGRNDTAGAADLQIGLVRCLAHPPRFLSITLTGIEPASLLLEPDRAEAAFGGASGAAAGLVRAAGDVLIPITLDLGRLSLENSGIVCGLAGKLAGVDVGLNGSDSSLNPTTMSLLSSMPPTEMSYLSTARGAAILVGEDEVDAAIQALKASDGANQQEEGGMEIVD